MTALTTNIRFMTDNYAALSSATVTGSGALIAFPVSNVIDEKRFKQWVPEGNFEIDATNNKLYFDDGAPQTATITTASYTPATLATEIATRLNAIDSGWTVTYDTTTFKFNLVNATGTRELTITLTTNAIWDDIGFTGAADITKTVGLDFVPDEIRCHTSEWLHIDLTVANEIDFVALIGALNEDFTISQAGTVTLMGNNVDSFSAPPFSEALSVDTFGAIEFVDSVTTRSYRYWKLVIVDRTNTSGPESFVFGHFYLGSYDTLTTSTVEQGFNVRQQDPSVVAQSENGARFFNRRTNFIEWSNMQMTNIGASERRTLQQLFYDLGIHTPFYMSLDPTLAVSAEYQEYTRYVSFNLTPTFTHLFTDYYSINMDVREIN